MPNAKNQKSHKKIVVLMVLTLALISFIAIYFGLLRQRAPIRVAHIDGFVVTDPKDISEFKLTDNAGQVFNKDSLKGRWTMLFFGFTNCGMVCPTTMAALSQMYQTLSDQLPKEMLPQIVMISVDPERDTVQRMNEYVTSFNPHFIGARAEMPQIEALEKEFHLVAVKMQADGQGKNHYMINHSAEILVINPDGKLQAFMSYPHKPEQMVQDYKSLLQIIKS